jgi:CheY-like chemotaxis protein
MLASSAAQALEVVRSQKPDIIVSDIGMPGEDGYTFIRNLRALPREEGGRIPAIALTAYARADDRRKALVAGFQNHAAKPIEPQELMIVIANLAGRYA